MRFRRESGYGPGAQYRGPSLGQRRDGEYEDIWGVWRAPCSCGKGVYYEISCYPLVEVRDVAELGHHRWPDPDWSDYAVRPELFPEIMARVTEFHITCTQKTLEAAGQHIESAFTGDDIAGQRGLLTSLPMWEQHIKPYHIWLNAAIHEFGTKVMDHSDGGVMDAVPGLIDMGVDVLQVLQFSAVGMEPEAMEAEYGNRLRFEGGVSVQTTLPSALSRMSSGRSATSSRSWAAVAAISSAHRTRFRLARHPRTSSRCLRSRPVAPCPAPRPPEPSPHGRIARALTNPRQSMGRKPSAYRTPACAPRWRETSRIQASRPLPRVAREAASWL